MIPVERIVPGARFVHVRTGGIYVVLMQALLEANAERAVVYRSERDGTVWVRPFVEFADGRFAEIQSADWPAERIGAWLAMAASNPLGITVLAAESEKSA
jgi:hypothetical protein